MGWVLMRQSRAKAPESGVLGALEGALDLLSEGGGPLPPSRNTRRSLARDSERAAGFKQWS